MHLINKIDELKGNKEEMAKKNDEKEGEMMKKNDDEGDEKLIEIEGEKDEGQKVVSADDSKIVDDLKVEEADKQVIFIIDYIGTF